MSAVLRIDAIRTIRRALLIGLSSFGEIERVTNQVGGNDIPQEWRPLHPTGSPDTVGEFADALRYIEHLETEVLEAEGATS